MLVILTVILELPGADGASGGLPEENDVLDSPVVRLLPVQMHDSIRHVRQDRVVRSIWRFSAGTKSGSGTVVVSKTVKLLHVIRRTISKWQGFKIFAAVGACAWIRSHRGACVSTAARTKQQLGRKKGQRENVVGVKRVVWWLWGRARGR